jgi:hypothetical protein
MGVKDTGVRIRVEKGLRDQFLETCRRQDKPAAQVLRQFMREYVADHGREVDRTRGKAPVRQRGTKS